MAKDHIVRSYDQELDLLQSKLLEMGQFAEEQLRKALEALVSRDNRLAVNVISSDSKVNKLQSEVDRLTVRMLAMRQPMALDLRHIISALRIGVELERVADYAANIGKSVIDLNHVSLEEPVEQIIRMAELTQKMLNEVMHAYRKVNVSQAIAVWKQDEEVNKIYANLLSQLRLYMKEDADNINSYTSLIFVSRSCERIGDHIKNIAECVYYIEKGQEYAALVAADEC
ncbi:MAG: phosphate signaling complex protein PhoU [Desulfobacterales bacterium]|jgi:phosphate transport system protein|nr:phosphate signaling complex protein PhoU [Deltaproteobacteria bacterium]